MEYKRISTEEVITKIKANKAKGDADVMAAAMAGLREGPMPVAIDPLRPFALQIRHSAEGQDPDSNWAVHPWRFPDLVSASRAAKDLLRLDPRLELRIAKASGS